MSGSRGISTSQEISAVLKEEKEKLTSKKPLERYFEPPFLQCELPALHVYKRGTSSEVQLPLRNTPKTAEAFFVLALDAYACFMKHGHLSPFLSQLHFPTDTETRESRPKKMQRFIMDLLTEAATAGHELALTMLATLVLQDPGYKAFYSYVAAVFHNQGHSLSKFAQQLQHKKIPSRSRNKPPREGKALLPSLKVGSTVKAEVNAELRENTTTKGTPFSPLR